jgi:hypothetical protein
VSLLWERIDAADPTAFRAAEPIPHIVLDDVISSGVITELIAEFPGEHDGQWTYYHHINERKRGTNRRDELSARWQATIDELQGPRFVAWLSNLTGIDGLISDRRLEGGGLQVTEPGGFLNVHADFTVHPRDHHLRRRLNVLLYLNPEWDEAWGGDLELWERDMSRCAVKIAPRANRLVVFATDRDSFHGHPEPLRSPPGQVRRSLALYYFTHEHHPFVRSTEYRARPGDGRPRAAVIWADKMALRVYDAVKRRAGFDDDRLGRILRRIRR